MVENKTNNQNGFDRLGEAKNKARFLKLEKCNIVIVDFGEARAETVCIKKGESEVCSLPLTNKS